MTSLTQSIDRNKKTAFKGTAKTYNKIRSGYPVELVKRICLECNLTARSHALEIGCGTGIATRTFEDLGFKIHAIDIADDLLECAKICATDPDTTFELISFEHFIPQAAFDLVFSATAFHWVDPKIGYEKVWQCLQDDGVFLILSNIPSFDEHTRTELDQIYLKLAPSLTSSGRDRRSTTEIALSDQLEYFSTTRRFKDFRRFNHNWEREFSGDDYVALLSTYSDHILLDKKEGLFRGVKEYIENRSTAFKVYYETVALVANKRI